MSDAAADAPMDPTERKYYLDNGVTAWIDVPLIRRGQVRAALCLVQDKARRWTASEMAIVEETAERCWGAVERAIAETAKRQSEERLALAFRTLPIGVSIIDAKARSSCPTST